MASPLDSLTRRFSPTRWLRTTDAARVLRPGGRSREWIVARALCHYQTIDCAQVPANRRQGYVAIAVRRSAPFTDPGWQATAIGDQMMVWSWSRAVLKDPGAADDLPSQDDSARPESLFTGTPRADGGELLACVEGVEGRWWRDGALSASRWWPATPDLKEWNAFLRGAGQAPVTQVPEVVAANLASEPWSGNAGTDVQALGRRFQQPLLWLAAGVAAAMFAWQIGALLPLLWQTFDTGRQIAALQPTVQPILDARERAERDLGEIQRLLALRAPVSQIDAMATLTRTLPAGDWAVLEWSQSAQDGLVVVIRTADPDPQKLVQALEDSGRFAEASAEPADAANHVRLRARPLPAAVLP